MSFKPQTTLRVSVSVITGASGLKLLQSPALLFASGFMLFIEFFADKIPGLDSVWDLIHTVVRIPAGAALPVERGPWGLQANEHCNQE